VPTNVDVAPLWFTLLGSPVDWGYRTEPQRALGGRVVYEPRGKLPGGSSNLYIMMHVRGHPSDFDAWAYQGAAGWSHADLLPYLERLETVQTVTSAGGADAHPMSRVFIDACKDLGYPETDDFNGRRMIGTGWHHIDVKDGQRQGNDDLADNGPHGIDHIVDERLPEGLILDHLDVVAQSLPAHRVDAVPGHQAQRQARGQG